MPSYVSIRLDSMTASTGVALFWQTTVSNHSIVGIPLPTAVCFTVHVIYIAIGLRFCFFHKIAPVSDEVCHCSPVAISHCVIHRVNHFVNHWVNHCVNHCANHCANLWVPTSVRRRPRNKHVHVPLSIIACVLPCKGTVRCTSFSGLRRMGLLNH